MSVRRLRNVAGLAATIVPFAILVHLVAEAVALGPHGLGADFLVRHAYFGALFVAATVWFCATTGIGRAGRERRRRAALLRADLRASRRPAALVTLVATQLGFFAITQSVEGVPIATGAWTIGLSLAIAGSIAAAFLVFFFGHAFIGATLDCVIGRTPRHRRLAAWRRRHADAIAPRHAGVPFSLHRPSRPPPALARI